MSTKRNQPAVKTATPDDNAAPEFVEAEAVAVASENEATPEATEPEAKAIEPEASLDVQGATSAAIPNYLTPDYAGPLTCEQAQARLAALGHHVKPAAGGVTK